MFNDSYSFQLKGIGDEVISSYIKIKKKTTVNMGLYSILKRGKKIVIFKI